MKLNIFAVALLCACSVRADAADNNVPEVQPVKQRQMQYVPTQKMLENTGGFVVRPGTMSGSVVYVNCQKKAELSLLQESAEYFRRESKFSISVKDGGAFDLKNPKIEGNATLYVIDDASLPPILVAPENRWTVVNVANLDFDGAKPAYFRARVLKELSRGFCMLCGASNSQYPNSLTRGITKPSDLDVNVDYRIPVDVRNRFKGYMESFGVTPAVITTYIVGCREGWASAPTNQYQKAVWDKVHAAPTSPIVIKPETTKQ